MQQPFSILQLRIHLQALYAEAITFSKLVEILNQTAADPTRHRWVSFSEQQPEDGENIILQYKTHEFDSKKYDASVADFYAENCLHWLNQKGKAAAQCNEIPDSQLTTSILNRLPGRTLKEKAQMLEQCFLPDGQPNYEGAILINCLRLLSSEQQGRLIENLLARGAKYSNPDNQTKVLCNGLNQSAQIVFQNNKAKGFWDNERNVGELLMLVTSELGEAMEAHRKGRMNRLIAFESDMSFAKVSLEDFTPENENYSWIANRFETIIKDTFEDEIADAVIRLLDLSAGLGIDLEKHINAKVRYNEGRPKLHGKRY